MGKATLAIHVPSQCP